LADPLDIVQLARSNDAFRREVATGEHSQIVVMTIPPGGEIGEVAPNQLVLVPAGTRHNFVNTGPSPLRLVTVYAPPEHAPGTVHQTKAEADAAEGH
jgi:oxalate decarboxylase/phosphoglucose isomerase-like protein (cupin superfamily)